MYISGFSLWVLLQLFCLASSQLNSLFHSLAVILPTKHPATTHHKAWQTSGKFQGDIDGVDLSFLDQPANVLYNALKNKKLLWPNGVVPYEMDTAFTVAEVKVLEKAFAHYRQHTCISFEKRKNQHDYLYITKGYGCYSQVGRTGGRQEISLGRGCLFHEIVVHELMHSIGFWHEHSRADRDDYIRIRWENILPGMKSQFDKISAALQDLQGERYDYRSIMHYDSTAFSKNGRNTIETVQDGFTSIIGSAVELSKLDIKKINKLYSCPSKRKKIDKTISDQRKTTTTTERPDHNCHDHFSDCPHFVQYCKRASFFFVMKSYCPRTCKHCKPKSS
uniref:Metalloendopeptidase n=1 Tax=Syphacia muris TaxID=451379 RepID=A0A158R4I3_9BILA